MTWSIGEQIKCSRGPEPENSMGRWIYPGRISSFPSYIILFVTPPISIIVVLFFALHCISFSPPCSLTSSIFPDSTSFPSTSFFFSVTSSPSCLPSSPPASSYTSSICSTDSWFPRGLRGDRDHRALWNLCAQISCWIRRWRRSAVALQGRGDERGGEKIRT